MKNQMWREKSSELRRMTKFDPARADSSPARSPRNQRLRLARLSLERISFAVLMLVAMEQSAHAYLEPGTFNFFLQTLVGAVFGAAIYIKLTWGRLKGSITKLFSSKSDEEKEN